MTILRSGPGGTTCVCGSGAAYAACCGPLHDGAAATTAEALMRSRYAAHALGLEDHLFRTWHPRTRPDGPLTSGGIAWLGLRVLRTEAGGAGDDVGVVVFEADHRLPGDGPATPVRTMRETSRFERRARRWVYVDALT